MNQIIDSPQGLLALTGRVMQSPHVGLDTEFVWDSTYYPALGIVQIALSEAEAFLVDVPAVGDLAPLGTVLADPGVTKIVHDAPQDLTILRRATGAFPRNIFDTRCAAGFLGLTSTASLSVLVRETIGISLPKTETRTDWLKRPLSDKQVAYALDDVRYLPALHALLMDGIEARGRELWLREELALYDDGSLYEEIDPLEQFRRIKGSGKLRPREQAILQQLASWREDEARRRDSPRTWVVSDETLVRVARRKPRNVTQLASVRGLTQSEVRYAKAILTAVRTGIAIPQEQWPQPEEHPKDDDSLVARVDLALAYLKGKGIGEGVDPALVASRSEIAALVREGTQARPEGNRLLQGWRRTFLGEELVQLLEGKLAIRVDTDTGLPRIAE